MNHKGTEGAEEEGKKKREESLSVGLRQKLAIFPQRLRLNPTYIDCVI
jgi:hypothetical protein